MNTASTKFVSAILRPWESGTVAVIVANLASEADFAKAEHPYLTPKLQSHFQAAAAKGRFSVPLLLALVKSAITAWVRDTPEGKIAWERSSENFNIGDLASENVPSEFLSSCGILSLEIETSSVEDGEWVYDTVLVDESELEQDDDEA